MTVSAFTARDVAIAIPTFGRDDVLVDTVRYCLEQAEPAGEVLVIDQTPEHAPEAARQLREWHEAGRIRWIQRREPSQPAAMNDALRLATKPLVLYLDDDIVPAAGFVAAHARGHNVDGLRIVVGQIIQPWQQPSDIAAPVNRDELRADLEFPFHSTQPAEIRNVMSGHMSVRRDFATQLGGFDENFKGAAYRFDTEFGRRALKAGARIVFEPRASIRHLRAARGGTRIQGDHLASASPNHGVGDYYFALASQCGWSSRKYMARRMIREVCTKFHLKHPWYIPVKLLGEVRACLWAMQLWNRGPALIGNHQSPGGLISPRSPE